MRLFAQDLTTDTLQHIAARGLSEAGGPKPLLLRVLVDLYVRRPSHSDDEVQHFAEIAHSILPCATRAEVDHAAERLCTHPAAPGELMDLLASRGGEGALLLFEKCRRLSTHVLQNAAAAGPREAAIAIARRDDLDPATIEHLAARPEPEIARALAKNESAPLGSRVLPQLVVRAQEDAELTRILCRRLPHRAECAGLFLQAARADRLLMIGAARIRAGEDAGLSQALEQGEETALRKLESAAQESGDAFALLLAETLPCPLLIAQSVTQDRGGEALVIALRALGADAASIIRFSKLLSDALNEGQSAWRHALALSVSRRVALEFMQAITGETATSARYQPLHDQNARESGIRPAPLTTAAEQKLQQSLSA
jgi:uncharacterized protein (DUF2336 family)